jgi:T5SS/PEP-CTERM-associated repeat protein
VTLDLNDFGYAVERLRVGDTGLPMETSAALTLLDGELQTTTPCDHPFFYCADLTVERIQSCCGAFEPAIFRIADDASVLAERVGIGIQGPGNLEIISGGQLFSTDAMMAQDSTNQATATIDGPGSLWVVSDRLTVSFDDHAELAIRNGGTLVTGQADLAAGIFFSSAEVNVSGPGSTWLNSQMLRLGANGYFALLRVDDGAYLSSGSSYICSDYRNSFVLLPGSALEVDGAGSVVRVANALVVGGDLGAESFPGADPVAPGCFGSLSISNYAQVAAGEQFLLWNGSEVLLDGGTLDVGTLALMAVPGEIYVHPAGFVGGTGRIVGDLRLHGKLNPGGLNGESGNNEVLAEQGQPLGPPRLLSVDGDIEVANSAVLAFDLSASAASGAGDGYDQLVVSGRARVDGRLAVRFPSNANSFPAPTDLFSILESEELSGLFANVHSGGALGEDGGRGSLSVYYGEGSPFGPDRLVLTDFQPACGDTVDSDGDGLAAYPEDPGCRSSQSRNEKPPCQDGIDNDGALGIDFDGGASLDLDGDGSIDAQFNAATPPVSQADPQCTAGWVGNEGSSCGLGFELVALMTVFARARRRRAIVDLCGRQH